MTTVVLTVRLAEAMPDGTDPALYAPLAVRPQTAAAFLARVPELVAEKLEAVVRQAVESASGAATVEVFL